MRADQWASYCLTWKNSSGMRLLVNGIDLQLTAPTYTFWQRNYTALACRLTVCRYASDMETEFRVAGIYDFCEMPFSDLFYYPASLEPDVLPSYVGLIGELHVSVLQHFSNCLITRSSRLDRLLAVILVTSFAQVTASTRECRARRRSIGRRRR